MAEREKCYDRINPLRKLEINPLFESSTPWEEKGILWGSVLKSEVDSNYKMFYSTAFTQSAPGNSVLTDNADIGAQRCICCYAESDDGIEWRRPALNLIAGDRFPDNNIVWDWPGHFNDSLSVIEDMIDPDASRRYKMLIYHHDDKDPDLCGGFTFVSADGLEWKRTGTKLPTQDAECLWQDKRSERFYAFLKDRRGANRSRMLSYSDDFTNWSEPRWIITPDHGDHAGTNFYNQTAFVMAGQILGFLSVYDTTTQTSWIELVESAEGIGWNRMPSRSPVLSPGGPGGLDSGGTYPGLAEPILMGDDYWFYYYASPRRHDEPGNAGRPAICVATFERNRLVGQQTEGDGFFSTIPILCPGGRLRFNLVSTDPVTVEIKRPGYGGAIDGYSRGECEPILGDVRDKEVRWKSGKNLDELEGRYVRIAVYGKNAKIYSADFVR